MHGQALPYALHEGGAGLVLEVQFAMQLRQQGGQDGILLAGDFTQRKVGQVLAAHIGDGLFQQRQPDIDVHDFKRIGTGCLPAQFGRRRRSGQEKVAGGHAVGLPCAAQFALLHHRLAGQYPDDQRLRHGRDDDAVLMPVAGEDLHQQVFRRLALAFLQQDAGNIVFKRFRGSPRRIAHGATPQIFWICWLMALTARSLRSL